MSGEKQFDQDVTEFNNGARLDKGNSVTGSGSTSEMMYELELTQAEMEQSWKNWAMEDMRRGADEVLKRAKNADEGSPLFLLQPKIIQAAEDVEVVGVLVGLAARAFGSQRLSELGAYAMASAFVIRKSLKGGRG